MSDSSILLEGYKTIPFSIVKIEFTLSIFYLKIGEPGNYASSQKYNAHPDTSKNSLKGSSKLNSVGRGEVGEFACNREATRSWEQTPDIHGESPLTSF